MNRSSEPCRRGPGSLPGKLHGPLNGPWPFCSIFNRGQSYVFHSQKKVCPPPSQGNNQETEERAPRSSWKHMPNPGRNRRPAAGCCLKPLCPEALRPKRGRATRHVHTIGLRTTAVHERGQQLIPEACAVEQMPPVKPGFVNVFKRLQTVADHRTPKLMFALQAKRVVQLAKGAGGKKQGETIAMFCDDLVVAIP